jgi:hypothetical protein
MELVVRPVGTDLFYQASFSEPMLELVRDEVRESLVRNLVKNFNLRLNDIRFDTGTLSDNFIHFSKFEGISWFDVSYGLEQVRAIIRNAQKEEQVTGLYAKLAECFKDYPISKHQMNIQRQLSTEGDAASYLKSLNPEVPTAFENVLDGRGVFYTLKIPEHELKIGITLVSSLFVKGGLYLSIENDFSPNLYDFSEAFKIARKHHDFILKELNLRIDLETSNEG